MELPYRELIQAAVTALPEQPTKAFITELSLGARVDRDIEDPDTVADLLSTIAYKSRYRQKREAGLALMHLAQAQGYQQACISRAKKYLEAVDPSDLRQLSDIPSVWMGDLNRYFQSADLAEFIHTSSDYSAHESYEIIQKLATRGDAVACFKFAESVMSKCYKEFDILRSLTRRLLTNGHVSQLQDYIISEDEDGIAHRNYEALFETCDRIFRAKATKQKGNHVHNLSPILDFVDFLIQHFDKAPKEILQSLVLNLCKLANRSRLAQTIEAATRHGQNFLNLFGYDEAIAYSLEHVLDKDADGTDDSRLRKQNRVRSVTRAIEKQPRRPG
ncbi:MAG: hypothetical protein OXU45_06470 [Candidatus Melainabacteria bacterium]|nr:hypothetical protein [Candidatus Melainabacteria bacterium]